MKKTTLSMHKNVALAIMVASLVVLPACKPWQWLKDKFGKGRTESASHHDQVASAMANEGQVLASMDGKAIISTKSLDHDFAQLLQENPQLAQVLPMMQDAKYNFLQGMVGQAVVDRYVADHGIDRKAEYQDELNRMIRSFKRVLNTKYFGMENPVVVSDAEVEKFYEDNKNAIPELMMSRGGVKAAGISFDKEDAARAFAAKAKGGDLAKVAKNDGKANKVHDFKFVNEQSVGIDNAVKNKIIALTKVPAVEVVKGDDKHFWVIQATEKQAVKYRPLEQVKVGLKQYMEKERKVASLEKEIAKLKEQYHVVINDEFFKNQKEQGTAANVEAVQAQVEDQAQASAAQAPATRAA